jgi:hypothetical protein
LIILGNATGFVFAVVALSISVVSFPLLLDRNVGVAVAVHTSVRAVLVNPLTMALWGLSVAASLVIGFLFGVRWPRVRGAGPRTCELASLPQNRAVNRFHMAGPERRGFAWQKTRDLCPCRKYDHERR